jgi:hypothetical protein
MFLIIVAVVNWTNVEPVTLEGLLRYPIGGFLGGILSPLVMLLYLLIF